MGVDQARPNKVVYTTAVRSGGSLVACMLPAFSYLFGFIGTMLTFVAHMPKSASEIQISLLHYDWGRVTTRVTTSSEIQFKFLRYETQKVIFVPSYPVSVPYSGTHSDLVLLL